MYAARGLYLVDPGLDVDGANLGLGGKTPDLLGGQRWLSRSSSMAITGRSSENRLSHWHARCAALTKINWLEELRS